MHLRPRFVVGSTGGDQTAPQPLLGPPKQHQPIPYVSCRENLVHRTVRVNIGTLEQIFQEKVIHIFEIKSTTTHINGRTRRLNGKMLQGCTPYRAKLPFVYTELSLDWWVRIAMWKSFNAFSVSLTILLDLVSTQVRSAFCR
jgi:hypothetical protein